MRGIGLVTIFVTVCLAMCAVGCSRNNNNGLPPQRSITIQVYNDHIQPDQATLGSGMTVATTVTNHSAKTCDFFISNYLQPTAVSPGKSRTIHFTTTSPEGNPSNVRNTATMGCDGNTKQQGDVVVQFKGVRGSQGPQ